MIRVGWLPVMWRARRRAANYVRVRRRSRRSAARRSTEPAVAPFVADTVAVPSPLPTATLVRGAGTASALLGSVRGWLALQAIWLRPRAIPMMVAFAGMLGVLASVNYLHAMNHCDGSACERASTGGVIWLEPAAANTIVVRTR